MRCCPPLGFQPAARKAPKTKYFLYQFAAVGVWFPLVETQTGAFGIIRDCKFGELNKNTYGGRKSRP
jgi:hypothetical protein